MRLKLRQYFCIHRFRLVASHLFTSQNLYKCDKCGVYYQHHYGAGVGCKVREPELKCWKYIK